MDDQGKTAFHFACKNGDIDEAQLLIKKSREFNIDLNSKNEIHRTAFHLACLHKKTDIVKLLMENAVVFKIDLEAKDINGKTGYQIADNDVKQLIKTKMPDLVKPKTFIQKIGKPFKCSTAAVPINTAGGNQKSFFKRRPQQMKEHHK